ncbi:MAG: hypothetical protein J5I92_06280 [Thiogranum sp.]|nr:hypothetical protein [Thiogranum sp.]
MYQTSAALLPAANPETMRLLEEIATLEQRLHTMGEDGDCAYERAMSTLYRTLVEERKQQLTELMPAPIA